MSRRDSLLDCKLYVGDLTREATEKDVDRAFSYYGPLRSVWVARNPSGFAFVEFEDSRDADDAVRGLDGSMMCGARIKVEHSTGKVRPKPWLRDGGSYGGGPVSRRGFDPSDRCYECGQSGHYAYDCRERKRKQGRYRSRSRSRSRSYERRRRRSVSKSRSRDRDRNRDYSRSRSRSRDRSKNRD